MGMYNVQDLTLQVYVNFLHSSLESRVQEWHTYGLPGVCDEFGKVQKFTSKTLTAFFK